MNKIWKETWKKGSEGSVQAKSKSGLDSDQVEAQSSGTSTAVRTSPGAAAAAPPNTGKPLLVSVEPHGPPKRKHPRTLDIADHPDHLAKRPRRGDDWGRDSLANRLPETVQDENSESQTSRLDAEEEQVLEQAKEQNSQTSSHPTQSFYLLTMISSYRRSPRQKCVYSASYWRHEFTRYLQVSPIFCFNF
jgi:hypothetical protein